MTKKRMLALIIAACILGTILLAVAVTAIVANSKNDRSQPTGELGVWQSMIKDDALIKKVVTTGAHDAGTKGLPYFAATQDRTIEELLNCGTRYFDLRISYADGKLLIYHGPSKGVTLDSVLDSVKDFMQKHTSEFVILDFQHFEEKSREAQEGTILKLEEKLPDMLVVNGSAQSDVEFVDNLTMVEVRGKCLVVWGRETQDILAKNYVFKRNNDNGTRDNSVIHSYYQGSLNKKSSSAYIKQTLPKYIDEYKKVNSGLFVLQGQLTDGLFVFGPHTREATHTDRMNAYVDSLKDSVDLNYINIIMRDFVTPDKNCRALKLNLTKNLVKTDSISLYEKMINDNLKNK